MTKRIVIAGCGFGGLEAAYNLKRMLKGRVKITAIDQSKKLTYLPGLPDLVSGGTDKDRISIPYKSMFDRIGVDFLNLRVDRVDWRSRKVYAGKRTVGYDYLIVSLGSEQAYYGIRGAKEHTLPFKSISDALELMAHVTEMVSSYKQGKGSRSKLRIAIVGGGITGIELVTSMKDLLDRLCRQYTVPRDRFELVLVDHGRIPHPSLSEEVCMFTERYLKSNGIKLVLGKAVTKVNEGELILEGEESVHARTIVWCAGIKPSSVLSCFGKENTDPRYGLVLNRYLQFIKDPTVFAIGDCGYCRVFEAFPIMTAQRAVEQANFASKNLYYEITAQHERKEPYIPRRFPTLISLCGRFAIMNFEGFWMKGGLPWIAKRMTQHMFVDRYQHNLAFLQYVDELLVSLIEFLYFVKMGRP